MGKSFLDQKQIILQWTRALKSLLSQLQGQRLPTWACSRRRLNAVELEAREVKQSQVLAMRA